MNGINLKTVQYLLGYKDIRMTLRYAHISWEHLQATVGTLDVGLTLGAKKTGHQSVTGALFWVRDFVVELRGVEPLTS